MLALWLRPFISPIRSFSPLPSSLTVQNLEPAPTSVAAEAGKAVGIAVANEILNHFIETDLKYFTSALNTWRVESAAAAAAGEESALSVAGDATLYGELPRESEGGVPCFA